MGVAGTAEIISDTTQACQTLATLSTNTPRKSRLRRVLKAKIDRISALSFSFLLDLLVHSLPPLIQHSSLALCLACARRSLRYVLLFHRLWRHQDSDL